MRNDWKTLPFGEVLTERLKFPSGEEIASERFLLSPRLLSMMEGFRFAQGKKQTLE